MDVMECLVNTTINDDSLKNIIEAHDLEITTIEVNFLKIKVKGMNRMGP